MSWVNNLALELEALKSNTTSVKQFSMMANTVIQGGQDEMRERLKTALEAKVQEMSEQIPEVRKIGLVVGCPIQRNSPPNQSIIDVATQTLPLLTLRTIFKGKYLNVSFVCSTKRYRSTAYGKDRRFKIVTGNDLRLGFSDLDESEFMEPEKFAETLLEPIAEVFKKIASGY